MQVKLLNNMKLTFGVGPTGNVSLQQNFIISIFPAKNFNIFVKASDV